jgi:hypothetical protein
LNKQICADHVDQQLVDGSEVGLNVAKLGIRLGSRHELAGDEPQFSVEFGH